MTRPSARRLLLQKLKDRKTELLGADTIPRRTDPGPAPLSLAQQRLWFLDQLEPGSPRFNLLTAVRLRGRLQPALLKRAVEGVVRRHEALRTRFETVGWEPVQVIDPLSDVPLPVVDLSGLPEQQEMLLHRLGGEEANRPFDLQRGPLLRLVLLRLGEDHHVLLLTMHQISMDRWSRGILVREVGALYRGDSLPGLPVQYADFAAWQRSHLSGERLERLLGWWKKRLASPPPPRQRADLPADRPRPPIQSPRGRMQFHPLRWEVTALQQEGTTQFMVLLAGLAALLHRQTGQEDLVVGAPIANRHRPEIDGLIGFFLNLLPLRLHPRPDLPFRELLVEARDMAVGAFAHQELPFERLVQEPELEVERDLGRHPLFQVTLVLQNAPMPPLELPGLTASLVEVDWGTTAFDLALFFWETPMWESLEPGLSLVTTASAALFDEATVARFARQLQSLLQDAVEHPGRPLSELRVLEESERRQMVRPETARKPQPPRQPANESERRIAGVWSGVLGLSVGAEDDFFELGGHSLQAMEIVARLRGMGIGTTVRALFELRTVAGLAEIAGLSPPAA